MHKVWIEAAINGPWGKTRQPGIPASVEDCIAEGIACAKAGACIVHTHAYEAGKRAQTFDWQVYARIIEGIRKVIDVPVYPSIPGTGTGIGSDGAPPLAAEARFAHFTALADRGLIEFAVVDPGSVNFVEYPMIPTGRTAPVYFNPEDHIRHGLSIGVRYGFHPAFAIYEPGFTRTGAALAKAIPGVKRPVYRFMFSEHFAWGFPPASYALDAHVKLLAQCDAGAPWMIAGLGVDIRPLIGPAVQGGGHVRVGLEDAPLGSSTTNVAWVEEAVRLVRASGGEPATVAEMRSALHAAA